MYVKITTIFLLCLSILSFSQTEQTQSDQPTTKALNTAGLRYLEIIVLNDDDEHIFGLKKEAFKITLNGIEQPISSIREINLLKPGEDSVQFNPEAFKENPLYHLFLIANVPSDYRLIEKMKEGLLEFLRENDKKGIPMEFFIVNPGDIRKLTEMTDDVNQLSSELVNAFSAKLFCHEMSFFMEDTKSSLINNLSAFSNSIAQLSGTKRIVFLSAGIPDTFGLDNFDTGLGSLNPASPDYQSKQQSMSLDQQRLESKKRKEFSDKLIDLRNNLLLAAIKLDFIDLSKSIKTSRPSEGMSSSRSSTSTSSTSSSTSEFGDNRSQYDLGVKMQMSSEVKLRIAKDLARIGGGELFEKALASSGKFKDYLNQILYTNAHYYVIEYIPKIGEATEEQILEINAIVENDDAEKLIYNQYLLIK
jgi:hypothetical protein